MIYQALPGTGAITAPSNTPVLESRGISVLSNLSRRGYMFEAVPLPIVGKNIVVLKPT